MLGHDNSYVQGALAIVVLFAVIGVGLWIITSLRRRMFEPSEGDEDMWSQIDEAYEAGEIDAEEYQRVRAMLAKRGPRQGVAGLAPPPDLVPRRHRPEPDEPRAVQEPGQAVEQPEAGPAVFDPGAQASAERTDHAG